MIKATEKNQAIIIIKFSFARKAPITKEDGDQVKLCRNSMRILNWQVRIENQYSLNINSNLLLLLQIDVLYTVKAINKSTTKDYHVHITQVEDTPVKAKKAEKEKKTSPLSSKSLCPSGSPSELPSLI